MKPLGLTPTPQTPSAINCQSRTANAGQVMPQ